MDGVRKGAGRLAVGGGEGEGAAGEKAGGLRQMAAAADREGGGPGMGEMGVKGGGEEEKGVGEEGEGGGRAHRGRQRGRTAAGRQRTTCAIAAVGL